MSDDEDDYLSEKFLQPESSKKIARPMTYAERRKEAARQSEAKQKANRTRSRREVEEEARREGLSKSLFERAREEEEERAEKRLKTEDGAVTKNKAMAMMLKMGFKEGQALGAKDPEQQDRRDDGDSEEVKDKDRRDKSGHLVEPLPLAMWAGRQGLGRGTRRFAIEPIGRVAGNGQASSSKQPSSESEMAYRSRARDEFEERRTLGKLNRARKTLIDLDEKNGVDFDVRWLDPSLPATIPEKLRELLDAGVEAPEGLTVIGDQKNRSEADRLRAQMRAEALQPLADSDDTYGYSEARREAMSGGLSGAAAAAAGGSEGDSVEGTAATAGRKATFDAETVQDAIDWLQLPTTDRLRLTLEHLREQYFYCLWCGAQYTDGAELASLCPGESEDEH